MSDPRIIAGLRDSELTNELDGAELEALAAEMSLRELSQGEVLVAEGSVDDHLYVVVSGLLGVVKYAGTPEEDQKTLIRPGGVAGELAFIDGAIRYASLVALHPTVVLSLERTRLEALVDVQPRLVYHLMRAIVRIVHAIQRVQSMQSAELTNYVYKVHGRY